MSEANKTIFRRFVDEVINRGEFLGLRPTDQVVDFENLELVHIRQGQILEHWGLSRISSILQHLGSAQPT